MGMSSLTVDRSNDSLRRADISFDIEGMVFPPLKPIVTSRPPSRTEISCTHEQQKGEFLQNVVEVTVENELLATGDPDGCETPKSEEHKIPKVLECPPAPRKPRPAPKRKTATLPEGFFFFPPDLESAFLLYRMSSPRKKLSWSKRISAVALEQNGGHHM